MNLPLYDLHIHYGGAIPVETVYEILKSDGHNISNLANLREAMTYNGDDGPYDFNFFLRKFDILNLIRWTEEHIIKTTDAVVENLAKQGTVYAEVRFSINKYLPYGKMTSRETVLFMCEQLRSAGKRHDIHIAPILSIKYESDRLSQRNILKLIDYADVCDALVGVDLVGDEAYFDADFYAPIFAEWRRAGRGLIAHVGESQSAENVRAAIERMKVHRVSHGIKASTNHDILKLANDYGVAFDVALTSNIKTGVITDLVNHPLRTLLAHGCEVSLGTDDPVIYNTTLEKEFRLAKNIVGVTDQQVEFMKQTAIRRAFERPHLTK